MAIFFASQEILKWFKFDLLIKQKKSINYLSLTTSNAKRCLFLYGLIYPRFFSGTKAIFDLLIEINMYLKQMEMMWDEAKDYQNSESELAEIHSGRSALVLLLCTPISFCQFAE